MSGGFLVPCSFQGTIALGQLQQQPQQQPNHAIPPLFLSVQGTIALVHLLGGTERVAGVYKMPNRVISGLLMLNVLFLLHFI